jgi:hypothetical protein
VGQFTGNASDKVRVLGRYPVQCRTDIDEKNVVGHCRPKQQRYGLRLQHLSHKARDSVVTAEAPCDSAAPRVEEYECEDDGKNPIHGRQHEYEGDEGEQPFPRSALESIGAVSWRKFGEKKEDGQIEGRIPYTIA